MAFFQRRSTVDAPRWIGSEGNRSSNCSLREEFLRDSPDLFHHRASMKFKFLVAATFALLPSAVSAQTVSQSPGTTYYTNGPISGGVSANQLFGVTLTAYWGATSSTYSFANLGSGLYGWSDANLTVSGLGVTPTYTLGWLLDNTNAGRNLTRLVFDAGTTNFLFDRGSSSLLPEGTTGGTPGSGRGFDFCDAQIGTCALGNGDQWQTQVLYTNQVAVNPNAPALDLYRTIDVTFGLGGISSVNPTIPFVGPSPADAYIKFDVDVSSSPVVTPEPSTYLLMATGLVAVGIASRRRRREG